MINDFIKEIYVWIRSNWTLQIYGIAIIDVLLRQSGMFDNFSSANVMEGAYLDGVDKRIEINCKDILYSSLL